MLCLGTHQSVHQSGLCLCMQPMPQLPCTYCASLSCASFFWHCMMCACACCLMIYSSPGAKKGESCPSLFSLSLRFCIGLTWNILTCWVFSLLLCPQVTNIGKLLSSANGTLVTFTLDPTKTECDTAEKFFYGGSMQFMYLASGSGRCCGTSTVAVPI